MVEIIDFAGMEVVDRQPAEPQNGIMDGYYLLEGNVGIDFEEDLTGLTDKQLDREVSDYLDSINGDKGPDGIDLGVDPEYRVKRDGDQMVTVQVYSIERM